MALQGKSGWFFVHKYFVCANELVKSLSLISLRIH